jgi:hypothetical protein
MAPILPTLDDIDRIVTDEAIAEYWERGYWIAPKLFDDDQIQRLRRAHERLWAGDYDYLIRSQFGIPQIDPDSPKVRQQQNAFWLIDEIRRVSTSPLLGKIAARLMRVKTVRLWHDQAIYKPGTGDSEATIASNIAWHQDYGYWQSVSTTNMCTAWVALQDTDLANGGMRMIVGSHQWGLVEGSNTFGQQDLEKLAQQFIAQTHRAWQDEPVILKAGQVSLHHSLIFHGSGPNRTSQPRMGLVIHMMPGDTVYRAGRQWHPNLVFLGPNAYDGQPFSRDYWPQIWPVTEA